MNELKICTMCGQPIQPWNDTQTLLEILNDPKEWPVRPYPRHLNPVFNVADGLCCEGTLQLAKYIGSAIFPETAESAKEKERRECVLIAYAALLHSTVRPTQMFANRVITQIPDVIAPQATEEIAAENPAAIHKWNELVSFNKLLLEATVEVGSDKGIVKNVVVHGHQAIQLNLDVVKMRRSLSAPWEDVDPALNRYNICLTATEIEKSEWIEPQHKLRIHPTLRPVDVDITLNKPEIAMASEGTFTFRPAGKS